MPEETKVEDKVNETKNEDAQNVDEPNKALDGATFEEGVAQDDNQLSSKEDDEKAKATEDANASVKDAGKKEDENKDSKDDVKKEDEDKTKESTEDLDKKSKQEKTEFAFQKKQKQLKEETRKREDIEQQLKETQAKLAEFTTVKRPVVPPVPDTLDPNYDVLTAERDEIIRAQVKFDTDANAQTAQQEVNTQNYINQRNKEVAAKKVAYEAKVVDLGISTEDASKYDKVVADSLGQAHWQTAEYMVSHEQGPLIVKYLATHPLELDALSELSPLQAVAEIEKAIIAGAKDPEPAKPNTPDPSKVLDGKGAPKVKHPALKGATFS
jgi:hypothetical protein